MVRRVEMGGDGNDAVCALLVADAIACCAMSWWIDRSLLCLALHGENREQRECDESVTFVGPYLPDIAADLLLSVGIYQRRICYAKSRGVKGAPGGRRQ
jgi:hypothetical protein